MKNLKIYIKAALKWFFILLIVPVFIFYSFIALIGNKDAAFQTTTQYLSLIPGKIGNYFRAAFLKMACPNTSDDIAVSFMTIFSHVDTSIRENTYIGPQCNIGKCDIGRDCLFGSGVHILSGKNQHDFSDIDTPIKDQGGQYTKISIGKDSWLGNNAVIMANIGKHCVIAAGSVVTKDIPDYSIAAGNPAKVIKDRPAS